MSSSFFLQFCDIKKLVVIFNNIANLVKITLLRKFPIFCQEKEKEI